MRNESRYTIDELASSYLKDDLEFAYEKCRNQRGISASLMSDVVIMWCTALGNDDVGKIQYADYGIDILDAAKEYLDWLEVNNATSDSLPV